MMDEEKTGSLSALSTREKISLPPKKLTFTAKKLAGTASGSGGCAMNLMTGHRLAEAFGDRLHRDPLFSDLLRLCWRGDVLMSEQDHSELEGAAPLQPSLVAPIQLGSLPRAFAILNVTVAAIIGLGLWLTRQGERTEAGSHREGFPRGR